VGKLLTVLAPRSIAARLSVMAAAGTLFMVLVAITVLLIARG
jgi:methyl-accepting chemotaxis protein